MSDFAKLCELEALKLEAQAEIARISTGNDSGRYSPWEALTSITGQIRALASQDEGEWEHCEIWDKAEPPGPEWEFVAMAAVPAGATFLSPEQSPRYEHENMTVTKWRRRVKKEATNGA